MHCQKSLACLGTLAVALCVEALTFSLAASQLRAQSIQVSLTFPPTQPRGAPPRTRAGGQRGPNKPEEPTVCLTSNLPLTAVTPNNNVVTTVSGNPTLFWYVPKTQAKSAEFVLFDKVFDKEGEKFNEIYRTTVAVKGTPGIVKLSIPASVSLERGKQYLWTFTVMCNSDFEEAPLVAGAIERTALNWMEERKLAAAKEPLEKAEVYAEAEVWQETLSLVAQLRYERPYDFRVNNAWRDLLSSVQLGAIASEPLVECCTVTQEMK